MMASINLATLLQVAFDRITVILSTATLIVCFTYALTLI